MHNVLELVLGQPAQPARMIWGVTQDPTQAFRTGALIDPGRWHWRGRTRFKGGMIVIKNEAVGINSVFNTGYPFTARAQIAGRIKPGCVRRRCNATTRPGTTSTMTRDRHPTFKQRMPAILPGHHRLSLGSN